MLRSFLNKSFNKQSVSNQLTRFSSSVGTLKDELLSNPEFDQAFPHLKEHKPST